MCIWKGKGKLWALCTQIPQLKQYLKGGKPRGWRENIYFDGSPFCMSLNEFSKITHFQLRGFNATENSKVIHLYFGPRISQYFPKVSKSGKLEKSERICLALQRLNLYLAVFVLPHKHQDFPLCSGQLLHWSWRCFVFPIPFVFLTRGFFCSLCFCKRYLPCQQWDYQVVQGV